MWHIYQDTIRFIQRLNPEEYLLLVVMAIAVGFFCLKGFGSRSNY